LPAKALLGLKAVTDSMICLAFGSLNFPEVMMTCFFPVYNN
jgi:hypothetical protein